MSNLPSLDSHTSLDPEKTVQIIVITPVQLPMTVELPMTPPTPVVLGQFGSMESVHQFDENLLLTHGLGSQMHGTSNSSSFSGSSWSTGVNTLYLAAKNNPIIVRTLKRYQFTKLKPPIFQSVKNFIRVLLRDEDIIYTSNDKVHIVKTLLCIIIAANAAENPAAGDVYNIISSMLIDGMIADALIFKPKCCVIC